MIAKKLGTGKTAEQVRNKLGTLRCVLATEDTDKEVSDAEGSQLMMQAIPERLGAPLDQIRAILMEQLERQDARGRAQRCGRFLGGPGKAIVAVT